MADFYVKSGAGAIVYANRTWSLTEKMVPVSTDATTNNAVAKRWVWEVTTAGVASGATTPTWPAAVTQDVTTVSAASGATVWTARKPGFSSGATPNWAFATIYVNYAFNAAALGDRIFVSNNHAESTTGIAWSFGTPGVDAANQIQILCVDDSATPPTTLATTGTMNNQTTGTHVWLSPVYVYGLTITNGSGGTGGSMTWNNASTNLQLTLDNCKLRLASSAANSIAFGTGTGGVEVKLINTTVRFGASTQRISVTRGTVEWIGGGLESGGTAPAALINTNISAGSQARLEAYGLDLSALGNNDLLQGQPLGSTSWTFEKCTTPSTWSGNLWSVAPTFQGATAEMIDCGEAVLTAIPQRWMQNSYGTLRTSNSAAVVGGATDANGAAGYSWKLDTTANVIFPNRGFATPVGIYLQTATGASVTATVETIANTAAAPTNQESALELGYLGTSNSPLGGLSVDRSPSSLSAATAQSSSTADWTAVAGARTNGAVVTTTSIPFKVASNPGRLFFVTVNGTLAGSEPAGYATMVDGDTIADNTATVRAGWRQKLEVTFTPQVAGTLRWQVLFYKASAQMYVDPRVTVA